MQEEFAFASGPSIKDVSKFSRILTPTPLDPVSSFLLLSIVKFCQFYILNGWSGPLLPIIWNQLFLIFSLKMIIGLDQNSNSQ